MIATQAQDQEAMQNLIHAAEAAVNSLRNNGNRFLAQWLEAALERVRESQ